MQRKLSGTKKGPKPKLLSLDIFRLGRGLPRERVGTKKFGMSLETREIKLFWRDIPGFCRHIPVVPEKFEKKKVRVQFSFPKLICSDPRRPVGWQGNPQCVQYATAPGRRNNLSWPPLERPPLLLSEQQRDRGGLRGRLLSTESVFVS